MLDQARGSDYTIWVVAALLYVFDAAKLLAPREILLAEAARGRMGALFSDNPFTITGRVVAFAPLLRPDRGVFVAPWTRRWIDATGLNATLESVGRLRRALRAPRVIAACGFLWLFLVGPVLTLSLGSGAAVVYTAALLYPTIAFAIVSLWWQRRHFGLGPARTAWLSLEILVCPAFLPNLVRKITAAWPVAVDGVQVLAATADGDVKSDLLGRLERRAEELMAESDDASERDELSAYLLTVRAALTDAGSAPGRPVAR